MGTVITIFLVIIVAFAILGALFSDDKEEGAKKGAASGCIFIGNLLPVIFVIVIAILIVRACT